MIEPKKLSLKAYLESVKEDNQEISPKYIDTIKRQLKEYYKIDSQEYIEEGETEPVLVLRNMIWKELLMFKPWFGL